MSKKIVTVVKETKVRYEVDIEPGKSLPDEDVINIVKARMNAGSPLGLLDEKETVKAFEVGEV